MSAHFSSRTGFDRRPNRLWQRLQSLRAEGRPIIDLTESNPTRCGLSHGGTAPLEALTDPDGLSYRPSPRGLKQARDAVVAYYHQRGATVDPERIVLSSSTSEAYAWLFKLLADPGDRVLVPRPGYPLFDFLATLEGVQLSPYRLEESGPALPEPESFDQALGPNVRALLAVSPSNPSGQVLFDGQLAELDQRAGRERMALVVDEVFADFLFEPGPPLPVAAAEARSALTFSLSGLSKLAGLPQMKLSWIVVGGPDGLVREALERLDLVADSYLSVATPVQLALPRLLDLGVEFRKLCLERLRRNRALLASRLNAVPSLQLLEAKGGWYACVRVPRLEPEEDLVLSLLDDHGVAVHPGYFFEFPRESVLVLSLLVFPEQLEAGLEPLLNRFS